MLVCEIFVRKNEGDKLESEHDPCWEPYGLFGVLMFQLMLDVPVWNRAVTSYAIIYCLMCSPITDCSEFR
uniref:Uncharacterized protein n=1 Tax=Anopheles dirus TaxID=7168 RepID=A0A182NW63_9DIPT